MKLCKINVKAFYQFIIFTLLLSLPTTVCCADQNEITDKSAQENKYVWDGRVKRVAVFKNGLGFFMREGQVNYRDGWALAKKLPPASFGTLAIYSHEEDQFVDIVGTGPGNIIEFDGVDFPDTLKARETELLGMLGLKLQIEYKQDGKIKKATGELNSISGEFVILSGENNNFAVPFAEVEKVQVLDLPLRVHISGDEGQTPSSGTLGMAYLRKGITWIPDYTLKILDDETAELTLRGTLVNEAEDLLHCDVSFVVGVPHFVHTDYLAPLAVGQVIRSVSSQMAPSQIGSQMAQRGAMFSNSIQPSYTTGTQIHNTDGSKAINKLIGNLPQSDAAAGTDYTVYTKENMTLRRGEKAVVTLFRKQITYSHVYAWTVPGRIEHKLVLHNDTDTAWTTGPCLTINSNSPLGEDLLKYVPRGGTGQLPVTTATNITHDIRETEIDRKLKAHNPKHNFYLDLVTLEGQLKIKNYEKQPVRIIVENPISGKPISASSGGQTSVDTSNLILLKLKGKIRWELTLQSGQDVELTYQYERYAPSR